MKDNKKVLNEAFFKKSNFKDKLPEYNPVAPKDQNAFEVTDTNEVKRRLAGTFGVTFGNNNIKSMASRSIKSFPIIISDNIEPETVIMLKKLMEEQYAEYINLLVSNQVVDLGEFKSSEDGNIAIQALDSISGTDFSKSRVANKANKTGKISADDIFANVPLYNLLRESKEIKIGDTIIDSLLENAAIFKNEDDATNYARFIFEHADEIANLDEEEHSIITDTSHSMIGSGLSGRNTTLANYYMSKAEDEIDEDDVVNHEKIVNAKRGWLGVDSQGYDEFNKITSADIVIDSAKMDHAVNRSVGEFLADPKNFEIRDRFEKATFLLQSRKIAGIEYYQYLLHLGIPVSDRARRALVEKFKIKDIIDYGRGKTEFEGGLFSKYQISAKELNAIANNRRIVEPIIADISGRKIGLRWGIGAGTAAGVGTGIGVAASGVGAAFLPVWLTPVGLAVLAAAAVGSSAYAIARAIRRSKLKRKSINKIEGWERVEELINQMNSNQESYIDTSSKNKDNGSLEKEIYLNTPEIKNNIENFNKAYQSTRQMVDRVLTESVKEVSVDTYDHLVEFYNSEENLKYLNETFGPLAEELKKDKDYQAQLLSEGAFSHMFGKKKDPFEVTKLKIEKIANKHDQPVIVTPTSMAPRQYAYGSTEIERRENKERKYNQPLIMTIKFKERFSGDNYSDNELTAVIGILGKVIRVPSEEMEYILKENNEGTTIEGFFKDGSGALDNMISDLLSTSKISKEVKNLPHSADVWKNLEKVATLAAVNRMSGRKSGNVANAHIVFSQKEIDNVRNETGVDYLRDIKAVSKLMRRYSAFTLMIANDAGQRVYIFDDKDNISWEAVPYSAIAGKDGGDQLNAALAKLSRL